MCPTHISMYTCTLIFSAINSEELSLAVMVHAQWMVCSHSLLTPFIHCSHLSFTVHTSHSLSTPPIHCLHVSFTVHTSLVSSPRVVYASLVSLYQQWYEVKIQISWSYQPLAYFFLTFYFVCMNVVPAGMTVHHIYIWCTHSSRSGGR